MIQSLKEFRNKSMGELDFSENVDLKSNFTFFASITHVDSMVLK